jgi:hypothetical protein
MLKRIFELMWDEVTGGWTELHSLCSTQNIIRMKKSRHMEWVAHVACMGK